MRPHCCLRCGGAKELWQAVVMDAGQFFESVTGERVSSSASRVISLARQAAAPETVTVQQCRNRRTWAGGSINNPSSQTRTFTLSEIHDIISATASLHDVHVGQGVAYLSGLMIGGRTSKVSCSIVLGVAETEWCLDGSLRRAAGFDPDLPWSDTVMSIRYVDDMMLVSPFYCASCLITAVSAWSPAPFDEVCRGTMVEWTDLKVTLPQDLSHPIEIDALPKPFSLPPSWDRPTAALRAYITGRVSRWHEMQLDTQQIVSHLVRLFQHAKETGWQARHFRWCLHTMRDRQHIPAFQVLREFLRAAERVSEKTCAAAVEAASRW